MKVSNLTFLTVSVVFLLVFGAAITANGQNKKIGINTVVIDAGHGGKDPGAVGRIYKEKDINLDVALRLGKMIGENYPDVKVVYTRKTDVLIPLNERGDIANKAGGDLFISIHVNSNKSSTPSGTATYVMGVSKASQSLEVAMKENDVILYEDDYSAKYQGYKPGSPESFIIFSMMQFAYQAQSCLMADMVQKQFAAQNRMPNRGVHQERFLVLWAAAMPSILAEFGFISNPTEEKFIGSDNGREAYARGLFNAFSEYKVKSERHGTLIVLDNADNRGSRDAEPQDGGDTATVRLEESGDSTTDVPADDRPVVYRVQVASSPQKLPKNSSRFGPYRGEVIEVVVKGTYKYFVGGTGSYKEALSLQTQVRKSIADAFLAAFAGDEPIPVGEARRRQQ